MKGLKPSEIADARSAVVEADVEKDIKIINLELVKYYKDEGEFLSNALVRVENQENVALAFEEGWETKWMGNHLLLKAR